MSERSELRQHGACFGAPRRSAHWCQAEIDAVGRLDDMLVHQ